MNKADITWMELLEDAMGCNALRRQPRGMPVRSLLASSSTIPISFPVILNRARKLNYRFMFAEAYMMLSGSNRVSDIAPYCKNIIKYSDNGIFFQGAYGPKITEQLKYVIDVLTKDRDSRQAVINIWRESPRESADVPCTLSLQFIVYEDILHCIATMRSSDLWLGYPYDIFNFSMVAAFVATSLYFKPGLGLLYVNVGDQHLYESNTKAAVACCTEIESPPGYYPLSVTQLSSPDGLMTALEAARNFQHTKIDLFNYVIEYAQTKEV
jgi:hypothetical protein